MTEQNKGQLRQAVVQRLESLQQAGVLQLPKVRAVAATSRAESTLIAEAPAAETASPAREDVTSSTEPTMQKKIERQPVRAASLFDPCETLAQDDTAGLTLEILKQQVAGCKRCSELACTRTQTVFGVGDSEARLCFLGEAPGADEDRLGEPFVGRGGQLLTKIIEACRLKREDVYILNMLKCRPPNNRNPLPTELANCREYLDKQLDLIRPEFICCVGAVAAQNLLGTTVGIGKLRGKIHHYRGAKVVCTYHPAFLLRSPSFKKETWEDMKFLMREMGTPVE
jgi:uracil-DNA glycosylase family 4